MSRLLALPLLLAALALGSATGARGQAAATLVVQSEPAGATVALTDGTVLGPTPLEAEVLAGPVRFSVRLGGYAEWSGEARAVPGERVEVVAVLTPALGIVVVSGLRTGESARVAGRPVAPGEVTPVPAGVVRVELERAGGTESLEVATNAGGETHVVLGERAAPGALTLSALVPGAAHWSRGEVALGLPLTVAGVGGLAGAILAEVVRADADAQFDRLRVAYLAAPTETEAVRLRELAKDEGDVVNRALVWRAVSAAAALGAVVVATTDAARRYRQPTVRVVQFGRQTTVVPTLDRPGIALRLPL